MYKKHSQLQKCANLSAGKRSDAPLPPRSTDSSDSGASNGKKTPPGKGRTEEPNKKQRTEDPKSDPGITESRARDRRRDKKANETHAKYAGTVADKDTDRYEDVNDSDTDQRGDDVKNGNADGQAKHEKMETETSESSEVPGEERPCSGGRPKDDTTVGDQKPEDMDIVEATENSEETLKDHQKTNKNAVGGDEHDGNHDFPDDSASDTTPAATEPSPAELKSIKEKAASRSSKKTGATKSTADKQTPDTKDTEQQAKLLERQQQLEDTRDSKRDKRPDDLRRPPLQHYQDEEWGFSAGHYDRGPGHGVRISTQKEMQSQRSLQASKQMAYQVFANVLTAIEEQEYREAKNFKLAKPEKSEAFIPDQSWKKDEDVLAGVEAQLTVFQAHMGFCPREVAEAAKVEMIDTTLYWAAARAEIGLPSTPTDRYAINLLEILYDGATSNTFQMLKESRKTFGRAELMENVGKIMAGQAKADHLDKQFRDDPRKEAKALPIRQGQNISDGIERLLRIAHDEGMNKGIRRHLKHHFETVSAR